MAFNNTQTAQQQPYSKPVPIHYPPPTPQQLGQPAPQSPPSKRDLKSWWKGFKGQKTHEPQVEQPQGIFGVPLRQSITYANVAISLVDENGKSYIYGYVPIVVAKCGVFLKEKATNVEGIFRLSGSEKRIKELRQIFDSPDRYGKGLDWDGYTVHDAANVLRRYLNQLPEPIVPLGLYDRFREPLRAALASEERSPEDMDRIIKTYQHLITELPPLNRQLLLYILDLLAVFASKCEENRMNSANLAAIFQPGLLSHPQHDMAPEEYRLSQDVLVFLIENQDHFLIGMRGTEADQQTVHDVQAGQTPPPATPNSVKKSALGRSTSNASAGAESLRRQGAGIRRNVSVNSRHSRQSNGGTSPASPALQALVQGQANVHRSNTAPTKRSPAIGGRLHRNNVTPPSPLQNAETPTRSGLGVGTATRMGMVSSENDENDEIAHSTPVTRSQSRDPSPSPAVPPKPEPIPEVTSTSGPGPLPLPTVLTPSRDTSVNKALPPPPNEVVVSAMSEHISSPEPSAIMDAQSQDRLLPSPNPDEQSDDSQAETSKSERPSFLRALTGDDTEKRQPNKLRKKRIPGSANPSAQSSSTSLGRATDESRVASGTYSGQQDGTVEIQTPPAATEAAAQLRFDGIPGVPSPLAGPPELATTDPTPPVPNQHENLAPPNSGYLQSYDSTLKQQGSTNSLRSGELSNELSQSDMEHTEQDPVIAMEQKEKRNRWRLSRKPKERRGSSVDASNTGSPSAPNSPRKGYNAGNVVAESSTTSFGSGGYRGRKSMQGDNGQMMSLDQLAEATSNGSTPGSGTGDKSGRGPVAWFQRKIEQAKEEKRDREEQKERERLEKEKAEGLLSPAEGSRPEAVRAKSAELKREKEKGIPEVHEGTSREPLE